MFEFLALTPEACRDWFAAVARSLAGGVVAASFSSRLPPRTDKSIAEIHVSGLLMKNPSDFHRRLGATSTTDIGNEFDDALADPNVHAIVLHVDSPGGTVDGAHALAEHILNSRDRGKQIHAHVSGMGASAAYWVASSAHKVYAATPSTHIGSIGVLQQHFDHSAALNAAGIKATELTSGPYKGVGSPNLPLSDSHRAEMQRRVDAIHGQFVAHVAKARGLSGEALKKVTDGRTFLGHDAVAHGLADGVEPFDKTVNRLNRLEHPEHLAVAPQLDVAARARVWAIAEEKRTGRHVTALESVNHILGVS